MAREVRVEYADGKGHPVVTHGPVSRIYADGVQAWPPQEKP